MDSLNSLFCAGLLIPPAFFLDSKLTGPNVRGVNGKAQRRFNARRWLLAKWVKWIWPRVIGHAIAGGRLPSQIGWEIITCQFPPDISIDAGDDAQADRDDVASGAKSRQEVTGKRGRDWQRNTDQVFAEDSYIIERCKTQSKETGVPLEVLLQRHGIMSKPTAPPPGGPDQPGGDGKPKPKDKTDDKPKD